MSPTVALGLLIAYFLLSIEVYLTTYTIGTVPLILLELRTHRAARAAVHREHRAVLAAREVKLLGRTITCCSMSAALIGIVGMGAMLVWSAMRHTRQLYDAERLP